jgi:hypothetical protein
MILVNFALENFGLDEEKFNVYKQFLSTYIDDVNLGSARELTFMAPLVTSRRNSVNSDMYDAWVTHPNAAVTIGPRSLNALAFDLETSITYDNPTLTGIRDTTSATGYVWSPADLAMPWANFIKHYRGMGEDVCFHFNGRLMNRVRIPFSDKISAYRMISAWGDIGKKVRSSLRLDYRDVIDTREYDYAIFSEHTKYLYLAVSRGLIKYEDASNTDFCTYESLRIERERIASTTASASRPDSGSVVTEVCSYHSFDRVDKTGKNTIYTVGFEVEKEDRDVRESYDAHRVYSKTRWAKERDGSLNPSSGYELVSPTYDLFTDDLDKALLDDAISDMVNASYTTERCGGHIHLGVKGMTGKTLFYRISPWLPLIYSLYVGRINKSMVKLKKNEDIIGASEKYQSVRIFDDHIEFRIISAVPNVDTLLWRRDLLRLICENLSATPYTILGMMHDKRSRLSKHLRKMYKSPSEYGRKINLYVYFANELLKGNYSQLNQRLPEWEKMFTREQISHLRQYGFSRPMNQVSF